MRLPHVGSIVCYNMTDRQLPAIVMKVIFAKDNSVDYVDLRVFMDLGDTDTIYLPKVYQGNEPGQWQWHDIPLD
jgi:hypothetical protein